MATIFGDSPSRNKAMKGEGYGKKKAAPRKKAAPPAAAPRKKRPKRKPGAWMSSYSDSQLRGMGYNPGSKPKTK